MKVADTIAAIATGSGCGAISIIRISGPAALAVADRIFRCAAPPPSARSGGSFVYGRLAGPEGDLDEGILLIFRAPKSYTHEDVVELQCHGGRESARRALALALKAGARMAEAGEFTKRAFLNGRVDLAQAEAVMDLIAAQSDRAARFALEQLNGSLSQTISSIYDSILSVNADVEALLDFQEDDFPDELLSSYNTRVKSIEVNISALLSTWEEGHRLRDGALVVISGAPNAGKSTLLNRLLGHDRAIVSPTPGTTRDTIEETMVIHGLPIRLVDTAGLRSTDCAIEQQGIDRAYSYIEKADLRLHLVDVSEPFSSSDFESLATTPPDRLLVILNKSDLPAVVSPSNYKGYASIKLSLNEPVNLQPLLDAMSIRLDAHPHAPPHATLSERHRHLVQSAQTAIIEASGNLIRQEGVVPAASCLRAAAQALGQITGRVYYADLLDRVFSRFCIGK